MRKYKENEAFAFTITLHVSGIMRFYEDGEEKEVEIDYSESGTELEKHIDEILLPELEKVAGFKCHVRESGDAMKLSGQLFNFRTGLRNHEYDFMRKLKKKED